MRRRMAHLVKWRQQEILVTVFILLLTLGETRISSIPVLEMMNVPDNTSDDITSTKQPLTMKYLFGKSVTDIIAEATKATTETYGLNSESTPLDRSAQSTSNIPASSTVQPPLEDVIVTNTPIPVLIRLQPPQENSAEASDAFKIVHLPLKNSAISSIPSMKILLPPAENPDGPIFPSSIEDMETLKTDEGESTLEIVTSNPLPPPLDKSAEKSNSYVLKTEPPHLENLAEDITQLNGALINPLDNSAEVMFPDESLNEVRLPLKNSGISSIPSMKMEASLVENDDFSANHKLKEQQSSLQNPAEVAIKEPTLEDLALSPISPSVTLHPPQENSAEIITAAYVLKVANSPPISSAEAFYKTTSHPPLANSASVTTTGDYLSNEQPPVNSFVEATSATDPLKKSYSTTWKSAEVASGVSIPSTVNQLQASSAETTREGVTVDPMHPTFGQSADITSSNLPVNIEQQPFDKYAKATSVVASVNNTHQPQDKSVSITSATPYLPLSSHTMSVSPSTSHHLPSDNAAGNNFATNIWNTVQQTLQNPPDYTAAKFRHRPWLDPRQRFYDTTNGIPVYGQGAPYFHSYMHDFPIFRSEANEYITSARLPDRFRFSGSQNVATLLT